MTLVLVKIYNLLKLLSLKFKARIHVSLRYHDNDKRKFIRVKNNVLSLLYFVCYINTFLIYPTLSRPETER